MKNSRSTAIIVAAGQGSRMNSDVPKQYLLLNERPILYYTLKAFEESNIDNIILVVGSEDIDYCGKEIVDRYNFMKVTEIVAGGRERYESVFFGLRKAVDSDYVLIHDGARPLIPPSLINEVNERVKEDEACMVGVHANDTVRIINEDEDFNMTPERKFVWNIQTPQAFKKELIQAAYEKLMMQDDITVTDDVMVLEQMMGRYSKIIEGTYSNIKVTTPEDLKIAKMLLDKYDKA